MIISIPSPKFPLGRLSATKSALASISESDIAKALARFVRGDWGELEDRDKAANEEAVANGSRILSAYRSETGRVFWIITEADRSATTVLLPEDY